MEKWAKGPWAPSPINITVAVCRGYCGRPNPERSCVPVAVLNSNPGLDPPAFGFGLPALTLELAWLSTKFSVSVEPEGVEVPVVVEVPAVVEVPVVVMVPVLPVPLAETLLRVMVPVQSGLTV
jgi:hypothetical protein